MSQRIAIGAGCSIVVGWLGVHTAYNRRSSQFQNDRVLFESLMQRYRRGNAYTQLRLRGIELDPDQKKADGKDVLRDAHTAMIASYDAQPRWIKAIQRLRRQKPASAASYDLDDRWLTLARERLYPTPPPFIPPPNAL